MNSFKAHIACLALLSQILLSENNSLIAQTENNTTPGATKQGCFQKNENNTTTGFPQQFTNHGVGGGGYMYSPCISPHDPNHIFINCDMGGIYRSTDGAQSFKMFDRDQIVCQVKGKVQFTSDPNILYVIRRSLTNLQDPLQRGELAKSIDGGTTWLPMPDPTGSGVHRLEVDPASTQRLILNEYNQLYFSSDGGTTWASIYHPSDDQLWLGGVVWDGSTILVGTNNGLLVSKNAGASFSIESHSGLPANSGIYHLAGAKSGSTLRLFCITAPAADMYAWFEPLGFRGIMTGIFRMNYTSSAAWANVRNNIGADHEIAWVDLAAGNTQTVWAASAANDHPAIFKSTNGGNSWTNVFQTDGNQNINTGWAGEAGPYYLNYNSWALGFEVSPTDPNHVLFTDGYGHITTDGGNTWSATYVEPSFRNPAGQSTPVNKYYKTSGLDVTTVHEIFWKNNAEIFACNTDIGQTYSQDGGETWTFARNTFWDYGALANNNWYRMVQRPDNQQLFAAVGELNDIYSDYRIQDGVIDPADGMVVRSKDGGTTWDTVLNAGHPVVWLEMDKNNPARIYASVVHHIEGGIFQSNDGGSTWAKLPAPPRTEGHPYNILSLNDGGLVVTYSARDLEGNLTLSESSGVFYLPSGSGTWQDRTAPAMKFYTKDIVIDPHDATQNTWYATVWGRSGVWPGPNNQGNGGLYRSTDRGLTWVRIFEKETTESITIHPSMPGIAYVTVENVGLYFTENLGPSASFVRVTSLPFWRPKRVFFKPGDDHEIWIATMGGGMWKGKAGYAENAVVYAPSSEDFPNPERGFYHAEDKTLMYPDALDASTMAAWRNPHPANFDANYTINSTLVYRGFYLENFKNSPISNTYLAQIQQDFDAARTAGVKLILRFAYTNTTTDCGGTYCRPYGDAPKSIVLQHIAQLKPLLQANADVIATLQMGFIGIWGEGYYTDYFGDDSQPPYGLTAQNWNDRIEVLNALLDALPASRAVQVRYPHMKQKAVYGVNAPTTSAPLTQAEAWTNTPKGRIGHHNDCFLSSENDVGTYLNYDIVANDFDTLHLKPYVATDSRFVPVGGETCTNWPPYSNCNGLAGGGAQAEMARMHWSFLNAGYNNALNNEWQNGGCMDEIKKRLGYRFELQNGEYSTEASPGQSISVKILLKNTGFAAPFNARTVRLLLRNTATLAIWNVALPDDPRSWLPGNQTHTLEHTLCLPPNMPTGTYDLLLHLADPYPTLSSRPEYAIRLANEGVWEASTGFNNLQHQITVKNDAGNPACAGETCFQPSTLTPPSADFTATTQEGCVPLTVTYNTPNAACLNFAWVFPGGIPASSTEPSPTVVYQDPGTYAASLTMSNAAGSDTKLVSDFIQALPLPTAGFSFSANALTVAFSNTSQNATSYSWNFGDPNSGSNTSVLESPVHIFSAAGTFNVVLTTTNNCGEEVTSMQIAVACTPPQVVVVADGGTQICEGNSVNLSLTGANFTAFQWYLNNAPIAGADGALFIASASGIYKIFAMDAFGCGNYSNEITVEVSPLPIPVITSSGNGAVCEGEQTWLHGTGGVVYQWLTPSGETVFNQEIQITSASIGQSGNYFLTVTDGAGCTSTSEYALTVHVLPVVSLFGFDTTYTNQDSPFELMGEPQGGIFEGPGVSGNQFTPEIAGIGTHQITYTFIDEFGCSGTDTAFITVTQFVSVGAPTDNITVHLYPNPNAGLFYLKLGLRESGEFNISLRDVLGRTVESRALMLSAGENMLVFEERDGNSGLYFCEIQSLKTYFVMKVIIERR